MLPHTGLVLWVLLLGRVLVATATDPQTCLVGPASPPTAGAVEEGRARRACLLVHTRARVLVSAPSQQGDVRPPPVARVRVQV